MISQGGPSVAILCASEILYVAFVLSLFAPRLSLVPREGCVS